MIVGLGTDLVDVHRFGRVMDRHGESFLESLFSPSEIRACRVRRGREQLAARFAAREAMLKALGTGLVGGMSWKDMVVVAGAVPGVYSLELRGGVLETTRRLNVRRVHLAITTTCSLAAATVVLEDAE